MSVSEFRKAVGPRIDAAHYAGTPTIITKNGKPQAVLVPYQTWLAVFPKTVTTEEKS